MRTGAVKFIQPDLPGFDFPPAPAAQAAATGGIGSFFKSAWRFLQGDWGVDLGRAYRTAKLENKALIEAAEKAAKSTSGLPVNPSALSDIKKVSIWNFGWSDAYKRINTEKELTVIAERNFKAAGEEAVKSLGNRSLKSLSDAELIRIGRETLEKTGNEVLRVVKPDVLKTIAGETVIKPSDDLLKQVGQQVLKAGKKSGWFKKACSFLGRKLGPALLAVFYLPKIISETKEGGIGAGLKETAKAAASLTAFALGGVLVGMFGWTGIGAFAGTMIIGSALSFGVDAGTKAILGSSCEEKKAEIAKAQAEMEKEGVPGTNKDIGAIDARMKSIKEYLDRKYVSNATGLNPPPSPFGRTTAFSGLDSSIFSNASFGGGSNWLNFGSNSESTVYPG